MEINAIGSEKKKGRFNIVDVLVILVALIIVFAAFLIFDPLGWFNDAEIQEVTVSYVIEIKNVDDAISNNIRRGESAVNASTNQAIGTVSSVVSQPSYEWKSVEGQPEMIKTSIAGKSDIFVTIDVRCRYEKGVGYIISGQQIAVGTPINLRFSSFVGSGYCVSIEELQ